MTGSATGAGIEPVLSSPWASRNFRLLLIGHTTSSLGNAITPVALAFAVLELGGSASELGLVVASFAAAEVVTVLFGGVLGDRVPRKLMMEGSAAVAAMTQTLIAVSLIGGWSSVPLLGGIGMLNGCFAALSGPSSQALTQQTVPAANLSSAISLRRLAQNTSQIVGYGVAGILVAAFGSGWAIAIDALTFAIAAVCFASIDVPHLKPGKSTKLLAELRSGAAEVFRHTWLWILIGQALVYHLFYGGVQGVLGPIVVEDSYSEAAWGWALAALMLGFMIGGLVTLRYRPSRGLLVGTAMLTLTAAFPAALALDSGLWLILAGAFLHGFGLEIFSVNWDLSIQQNVTPDKLARVYSFDIVGSFVARPLGLALTGPIAEAVGLSRWIAVVAAVMFGSVLLALCVRSVRDLRRTA
jgi:MFS family permease